MSTPWDSVVAMEFYEALDEYCLEHTAKAVSEKSGIPPSTISGYRDGVEPNTTNKAILSEIIGYSEQDQKEFKQEIEYIDDFSEVTARLGIGLGLLRNGLKQKVYPFGYAIKGDGERYYYKILRKKFEEYIAENS